MAWFDTAYPLCRLKVGEGVGEGNKKYIKLSPPLGYLIPSSPCPILYSFHSPSCPLSLGEISLIRPRHG